MKNKRRTKKKRNWWQRLKAFFTFRQKREVKIEWDEKTIKKIGQVVSQEVMKVVAKILLDKRWINNFVSKLKEELKKELSGISREAKQSIEPTKIKIKESFINPIEDGVKLKARFTREPKRQKTSAATVEKSLEALKRSRET